MYVSTAAIIFSIFTGVVVLFQLALAAGMPWGSYAMGGKYPGQFPPPMRVAAIVQALILAALALIVLVRADRLWPVLSSFADGAIWFVVAFSAISVILNSITRSKRERAIWLPVTLVLLASSLVVALG